MKNITNEKTKLALFTIYTLIYEILIWGVFLYLIVYQNWNEWTIVLAMLMSASQIQPEHFGLYYKKDI